MTTLHNNDKVHISMIATITDEVDAQDKLIGTDEETLKTKNFFPRDLRNYTLSPWKISKFFISQEQVLASSVGNPIILLPALEGLEFYEFSPIFANMFINVVTNPANPFVCGAGDDLKLGWFNPSVGFFWNNGPFFSLNQSQITNSSTQMVRWEPFQSGVTSMGSGTQWQDSIATSQNTAIAVGPRLSGAPGWITGEGYWEVELMYKKNEMLP
jgi:hypothetical protein